MSGATARIDEPERGRPEPSEPSPARRAVTMVAPSVITFVITVTLFASLRDFDAVGLRLFTVAVLSAVILSLLGTAPLTPVIIGIIGDGTSGRRAIYRVMLLGGIYSVLWSVVTGAALYGFLTGSVGLSTGDFALMTALVFMQSLVWIVLGAYSATKHHNYFAAIFIFGYVVLFALTYTLHQVKPAYTLAGYAAGMAVLLGTGVCATGLAFAKSTGGTGLVGRAILTFARGNLSASAFHVLYVVAIFLDKITVWAWAGQQSNEGLTISGSYTMGSFLGLVPIFALGVTAHFEARATPLVRDLYRGRLSDIQRTAEEYKRLYRRDMWVMLFLGLAILGLTAVVATRFFPGDHEMIKVLLTTGVGCVFLSRIMFDYMVLSFFGQTLVSTMAMLVVCVAVLICIPFVRFDVWYASAGFLVGTLVGSLFSQAATGYSLHSFEFHIFHIALKMAKEESVRDASRKEKQQLRESR